MIMRAYTVFDRKALVYHLPFYAVNDPVAVRTLGDAVVSPDGAFGRHPNDYVLYCCGTFDDNKAIFTPMLPLLHVIDAIALVQAVQSEIPFPETATTSRPSTLDTTSSGPSGSEREQQRLSAAKAVR